MIAPRYPNRLSQQDRQQQDRQQQDRQQLQHTWPRTQPALSEYDLPIHESDELANSITEIEQAEQVRIDQERQLALQRLRELQRWD